MGSKVLDELKTIHAEIIIAVTCVISIIGSLLIITTYALYENIRSPARHIIVCIGIADLFLALANVYSSYFVNPDDPNFEIKCKIQSFVGTSSVMASFMWTMMLAVFLFISLDREKPLLAIRLIHPWFHLLAWLLPLAINLVAIFLGKLGNNDDKAAAGWCWIWMNNYDRNDTVLWMLLDGKGLEIVTYIVILILYTKLKFHLKTKIRNFERFESFNQKISGFSITAAKRVDQKIIFVPVCFILLRVWGTIRFLIFAVHPDSDGFRNTTASKVLLVLQLFGDNLVGFANCLLFCFLTPKIREHMKDSMSKLMRLCCLCCGNGGTREFNASSSDEDLLLSTS